MALNISGLQAQVANPFMSAMQGFQQGQQQRVQEDALRLEQEKVQAKQQRQAAMQQAIGGLFDPSTPTTDDQILEVMVNFPELKEVLMEPYKNSTEDQKAQKFKEMAEFQTMLSSGNTELAMSALDRKIEAAVNSNRPEDAELFRFAKQQMETNPEAARESLRMQMFAIDPERAKAWSEGQPKQEEPDITAKQNDYMFYRRQEQEAGREPLSFNEWDQQARAAGATKVSVGGEAPQATAYEKKIDQLAAAEMVDWTTQGRSQSKSNLSEFRRIQSDLESGKINTRTVGDFMPFVSDEVRKIFNEPAAEAVNDVRAIAFQVLRETLGAQFTEKEGERLIATYFDPQLSEKANIKRMERMANFTEQLIEDKDRLAAYMDKKRTAIGFQSIAPDKMQAIRDFVAESDKLGDEAEGTADTPMKNSKGWQLMTDANGNQAYVGPNGEIEEVR